MGEMVRREVLVFEILAIHTSNSLIERGSFAVKQNHEELPMAPPEFSILPASFPSFLTRPCIPSSQPVMNPTCAPSHCSPDNHLLT
jgi:hypothetical protein